MKKLIVIASLLFSSVAFAKHEDVISFATVDLPVNHSYHVSVSGKKGDVIQIYASPDHVPANLDCTLANLDNLEIVAEDNRKHVSYCFIRYVFDEDATYTLFVKNSGDVDRKTNVKVFK